MHKADKKRERNREMEWREENDNYSTKKQSWFKFKMNTDDCFGVYASLLKGICISSFIQQFPTLYTVYFWKGLCGSSWES